MFFVGFMVHNINSIQNSFFPNVTHVFKKKMAHELCNTDPFILPCDASCCVHVSEKLRCNT
jgi:hypothetical protein